MNIKEKVGLLGVRPASAGAAETRGTGTSSPYEAAVTAASATKADRQAAALQLWNRWASEALGPMSADPTSEELARKSRRVQRLEGECAALAARAQQRLDVSSSIRAAPVVMGGGAGAGGGGSRRDGGGGGDGVGAVLLRPGAFSREVQYAVRERRKAAAYAAAKAAGEAEAAAATAADADGADAVSSVGAVGYAPSFKSRAMLDALIASRAAAAAAGDGGVGMDAAAAVEAAAGRTLAPTQSSRQRPRSAMPQRSVSMSAGRIRPRSAMPAAGPGAAAAKLGRQVSISPEARGGGSAAAAAGTGRGMTMAQRAAALAAGGSGGGAATAIATAPGMVSVPEGEYLALRQEVDSVSERLAATQAALEVQGDTEAQLREAVDLLRARLHSAGVREVDAQRRLAQHTKLEPLFDRLAEAFTFSSPEEVVARLEFLEDDKLGTFDQLLRTQEEVTRLQQRLAEAQKAGETVATRLTTEHLQGSARLQEQNEELRQELESMETLVQKLTARQAQLVALQTAVLQLWGKLTDDPTFAEAFTPGSAAAAATTAGGGATASGGKGAAGRRTATSPGGAGAGVSLHGGLDDAAAAAAAAPSDPLAMLHMIEEFVTAKSGKLAIRHFTDIQRIADHVWQQHFRNRAELRGRVVPTFEQLSKVAGRMADRVRSVQDQAGRSQEAEKQLMRQVRRLQQQKRALETQLARRDEQFKSVMGVPRRARPASAAAEVGRMLRREASIAAATAPPAPLTPTGGGPPTGSGMSFSGGAAAAAAAAVARSGASRAASTFSLSGALAASGAGHRSGGLDGSFSMASGVGSQMLRPPPPPALQTQFSGLQSLSSLRPSRPASAPNATSPSGGGGGGGPRGGGGGGGGTSASKMRRAMYGAMTTPSVAAAAAAGAAPAPGGTLAAFLSPAVAGQVPQITSDMPLGAHWQQHVTGSAAAAATAIAQRTTGVSRPPGGSLFFAAGGSGGGGGGGGAGLQAAGWGPGGTAGEGAAQGAAAEPQGPRWVAPQRNAFEQAFLTRPEHKARVG